MRSRNQIGGAFGQQLARNLLAQHHSSRDIRGAAGRQALFAIGTKYDSIEC